MLPVHHRPDIYEAHAADVDPQGTCYYPLDTNEPTAQPGHIRPTGRNPLPGLPATHGSPTIDWSFNGQGKIETDVSLVIGDEAQTVSFWDSDLAIVAYASCDAGRKSPS